MDNNSLFGGYQQSASASSQSDEIINTAEVHNLYSNRLLQDYRTDSRRIEQQVESNLGANFLLH